MWRIGVLCLVGVLASAGHARDNLKRIEGVSLAGVGVAGGALREGGKGGSRWMFRQTRRGTLIYLAGGGWGGWYLNYDHRGKDARVGLVPEPGPGCYWSWEEREEARKKNSDNRGYSFPCVARPANGPMKGWSLALEGGKLILAKEPAAEVTFRAAYDDLDDGK
jgi:hypothetical protein